MLVQDKRRRDHLVGECPDYLADFIGMLQEEVGVETVSEQRC